MNRTKKLVKNSFIYLIANFASKLLNIVLVPIYTVYIQTDDFGTVNLLLLFSGIIGIIFSVDVIDAAYRYLLDDKVDKERIVSNSIFIYVVGGMAFSLIYFPVAIGCGVKYGMLLGAHVLLTNFHSLIQQVARGLKYNSVYASSGVIMCLVQGVSNIVMIVWFGIGGVSILLAPLIASVVSIIYISCNIRIWKFFVFAKINTEQIKVLLKYGAPVGIAILSNWIIANSGTYILTWITGATVLSGVYALANKFPTFISAFTSIFNLAWQETAVEEYGGSEYITYYNKVLSKFAEINLYAFSALLPMIAIYFQVMDTHNYAQGKTIVPFLLLASIISSIQSYLITGYYVVKQTQAIYKNALISSVITIIFSAILIPMYELYGLVASVVIGQGVLLFITYRNVRKHIAYKINWRQLYGPGVLVAIEIGLFYSNNVFIYGLGVCLAAGFVIWREKTSIKKICSMLLAKRAM